MDEIVMQQEISQPLLKEIRNKNEIIEKSKSKEADLMQKLTALRAILKTPTMYKELQKALFRQT
jgi:hypothetical protein